MATEDERDGSEREQGLAVVGRDDVMAILCGACPSFAEAWDPKDNLDDGERLIYLDVGEFAAHVLDLVAGGRDAELRLVFDAIERLMVDGDESVRELATVGVLEGLQSALAGRRGVDPETQVRPWLRPESRRWWDRLDRFWAGDAGALLKTDGDV